MVFLKVPVIIIIRLGKNNVSGTIYIPRYINFGVGWVMVHGSPYIYRFIIRKSGKITRA